MMFSDKQVGIRTPDSYKELKNAKRITLNNEDHDVFGDGTVVIKTAPGHTPGHQMLFLRAARSSGRCCSRATCITCRKRRRWIACRHSTSTRR